MKISVRVKGEWFAVPVSNPQSQTIEWLSEEALRKYVKLRPSGSDISANSERVYEIRKAKGGSILDPDDLIIHVLDDNDFVSLGMFTNV